MERMYPCLCFDLHWSPLSPLKGGRIFPNIYIVFICEMQTIGNIISYDICPLHVEGLAPCWEGMQHMNCILYLGDCSLPL